MWRVTHSVIQGVTPSVIQSVMQQVMYSVIQLVTHPVIYSDWVLIAYYRDGDLLVFVFESTNV